MNNSELNVKTLFKLKSSKGEEVYSVDILDDNIVISPLKPIIDIFDTLSVFSTDTINFCDINMSEVFVNALFDAVEKKANEKSYTLLEKDFQMLQINPIRFREVSDCFPESNDINYGSYLPVNDDEKIKADINKNSSKLPVMLSTRKKTKIGRNDLCPCGSGKKYKYCCESKVQS
ncbi:MAG: SEC-C domain-containing protein [Bacteroidales bacterium]|jgi:rRNA-processing protein FCF1|nr:SEC-C domain-containing protein [Bacteroidales bacterium]